MHLLQNFKELTIRPKNAQELKGLILQLAIQGKLTANWRKANPNVEPASELLKRVEKVKEQLIIDKKISKEKPLSHFKKNELPFELPKSWQWCRFNNFCEKITQGPNPKYHGALNENFRVLKTKDFYDYKIHYEKCEEISEDIFTEWKRFELKTDDIIFGLVGKGSTGKCNIFHEQKNIKYIFTRATGLFRILPSKPVTPFYIKHFFNSLYGTHLVEKITEGSTGQLVIRTSEIKKLLIPVPPQMEQEEIVRVVETLFKEVEQLEQLTFARISLKEKFVASALNQLTTNKTKKEWAFLQEHFHTFFNETNNIKKLRETVLQLAVQGKLTADWRTSNPNVEDASVLLKRIQKEKAQLIKDKKIKKETPLRTIAKNEIPYELPEGWVWCSVGDISTIKGGKRIPKGYLLSDTATSHIYIRVTDMKNGSVSFSKLKYITDDVFEIIKNYTISKDDLYITIAGTIGDVGIIPEELHNMNLTENAAKIVIYQIDKTYLKTLLNSHVCQSQFLDKLNQMAQPKLALHRIASTIIPLPPLEEQKAIVQKVNALMGFCDALEKEVKQSQEQSEQLMQSVLKEVFEVGDNKIMN